MIMLNLNLIKQNKIEIAYFNKNIAGYKSHDKEAGRKIDKDKYINVDWLNSCRNSVCCYCSRPFYFTFDDGNITSTITANRICNDLPHDLDNIVPCCTICNCSLSNKNILN